MYQSATAPTVAGQGVPFKEGEPVHITHVVTGHPIIVGTIIDAPNTRIASSVGKTRAIDFALLSDVHVSKFRILWPFFLDVSL